MGENNHIVSEIIRLANSLQQIPAARPIRPVVRSKKKAFRRRIEQLWLAKYKRLL